MVKTKSARWANTGVNFLNANEFKTDQNIGFDYLGYFVFGPRL